MKDFASKYLTVNQRDLIKTVIVTALTVFISTLGVAIDDGGMPTWVEIKNCLLAGGAAGFSYFIKNLFTNEKDQFLKRDPQQPNYFKKD